VIPKLAAPISPGVVVAAKKLAGEGHPLDFERLSRYTHSDFIDKVSLGDKRNGQESYTNRSLGVWSRRHLSIC
jgi:hypothetical protein